MGNLILNFVVALFLLHTVAAIGPDPVPFFKQFFLPSPAFGPDSIGFAKNDPGTAYVSISDGRVLKLTVDTGNFTDFAFTAPGRNKAVCDGNVIPALSAICGKVFGLSVDNFYQVLYLGDANLGLFLVPLATGGQATLVTNTAGGQPLRLTSGVDVDPTNGDVYITDSSQTLNYANITPSAAGVTYDSTGRLIKFDPRTGQVTVLLTGLAFPTGPAVSSDGAFVLISQIGAKNILKYFIRGPLAGSPPNVLLTLPGIPTKIKRASTPGDFWVAVNQQVNGQPTVIQPIGYRFDALGIVPITKDLSPQYPNIPVSAIQETNPFTIYVGARGTNYITQYYR